MMFLQNLHDLAKYIVNHAFKFWIEYAQHI